MQLTNSVAAQTDQEILVHTAASMGKFNKNKNNSNSGQVGFPQFPGPALATGQLLAVLMAPDQHITSIESESIVKTGG